MKVNQVILSLLLIGGVSSSCNKSSDDTVAPIPKVVKLGTTWTYQLDVYSGTSYASHTSIQKASSQSTLGGETWFNITDETGALIYLLNMKTGGLYQYTNNTSNLLCKYPASLNDTYATYNSGGDEIFTVKQLNVSIAGYNNVNFTGLNLYEGVKDPYIMDKIWYGPESWIVKRETWKVFAGSGIYRMDRRWRLLSVIY